MSERDDLNRTLAELGRVARGAARMLVGTRVGGEDDGEPVISSEVDAAMEGAVAVLGDWLKEMGEELQEQSDGQPSTVEAEGWSPLAIGAQTFGLGLVSVAKEFADALSEGEE